MWRARTPALSYTTYSPLPPKHHPKRAHTTYSPCPTNLREEKRILGSHMCQALLEKIKYDLIIARGNESFDMRYNLDIAHAADLPINSLVRVYACINV